MTNVETKPAAMREGRDIEWLVNWALEKQGLGRDFGSSGTGRSGDIPTGMKVDGGGYSRDGRWVSADAEIIAGCIDAMSRDQRTAAAASLVVHYGRVGTRPDWGADGSGRWEPVRKGNGKIVRRYRDPSQWRDVIGFEWEWVGLQPADLDRLMLEWMAWRAALVDLREKINPKLRQYVATGPAAPEAPWDEATRTVTLPAGRLVEV